jgi:hypothetical protein
MVVASVSSPPSPLKRAASGGGGDGHVAAQVASLRVVMPILDQVSTPGVFRVVHEVHGARRCAGARVVEVIVEPLGERLRGRRCWDTICRGDSRRGRDPLGGERPLTRRHPSYQRHRRYLYRLYWVIAVEVVCGGRVSPLPSYKGHLVEVREGVGTWIELVVAWSLYPLGGV